MPLRKKLLRSMILPALLLLAVGVIGIGSLGHLEQAAGRILSNNYHSIQEARRMTRALRLMARPAPPADVGASIAATKPAAARDFEEALGRCEKNITEPGEKAILDRIRRDWKDLVARPRASRPSGAGATSARLFQRLHDDIDALVTVNELAMFAYENDTRRVARLMLASVTASALAALIALVLFAIISARRISRPVTEVADRLHEALNPPPRGVRAAASRDVNEIARLGDELDALLLRLRHHEDEQATALSQLQGRLALVMNEVLEGLVLVDSEHRILAANRVGRALLGMPGGEGHRIAELDLREDVRALLTPVLEGTFQPEHDLGEVTFEVDGAERVFRPRVLTLPASGESIAGYLLLFWDVTEQRRFEEARRRFISMLSHQLKTPMTSLTMSVSLLREKLTDVAPAQAELLSIATENCNSLAALISDLIEAAREVTPDLGLKPQRVDLGRLLRAALRPLVPQAQEKGVALILPTEGERILASVDPVKFPWVVTNIAGNAIRYTNPGGRIAVALHAREGQIEVSVEDSGAGISPENLERIFQPYVSLDRDPQPGTHGLGLAIAKEIVEAHGGTIGASSERGRGTTFRIRVPV